MDTLVQDLSKCVSTTGKGKLDEYLTSVREVEKRVEGMRKMGEKIREIVESGTWKLRHPVGPDAEGFLAWRASMSDEQWVEWGAISDEQWVEYVRQNFHLNVSL